MNHVRYRAAAVLLASALLAGCAGSHIGTTDTPQPGDSVAYPVTVTSCGVSVTYDQAPKRAVSNDINTTEDMLALGLESRMVGDFGVTGDGPAGKPVPTPYQAGFVKVRDVSPSYLTLESLVGLKPDFLFAGWNYGLQGGTNLTPDNFTKYGIKTLVLAESCAYDEVTPGPRNAEAAVAIARWLHPTSFGLPADGS